MKNATIAMVLLLLILSLGCGKPAVSDVGDEPSDVTQIEEGLSDADTIEEDLTVGDDLDEEFLENLDW